MKLVSSGLPSRAGLPQAKILDMVLLHESQIISYGPTREQLLSSAEDRVSITPWGIGSNRGPKVHP